MRSRVAIPPEPRVATIESTARALRREMAAHNRQVILIAGLTFLLAGFLWFVLYAVCCWLILLVLAAADTSNQEIPYGFTVLYAVAAASSVAAAWLKRRLTPDEIPRDNKSLATIAADFLLALPRITLAIWGTLSAAVWLTPRDLSETSAFLHRLAHERRVPLRSVPLDIPNADSRLRILFALQIVRVIDLRREKRETSIRLSSSCPRSLFAA